MRRLAVLLISLIAAVGLAGSTQAAPLNWEGTNIFHLGDFPDAVLQGGGVATVNGSSGGLPDHLDSIRVSASRGNISTDFTLFVTDPEAKGNLVASIQFVGIEGQTGTFSPISGAVQSTTTGKSIVPVQGIVKLCLLATECTQFGALNLTTLATNGATIGIGIGGLLDFTIAAGFARLSVEGNPWQIKTTTVVDHITTTGGNTTFVDVTLAGFAHDPGSGTTNTAQPGGVVQLVQPNQVRSNLPVGSNQKVAAGQELLIRFIPEPGLLLLLGSGVAGLALLGRSRMKR